MVSLETLAKKENFLDPNAYASSLAELGVWGLIFGDWQCGHEELNKAFAVWERLKIVNGSFSAQYDQIEAYWKSGSAAKIQGPNQSNSGCKKPFPSLDWL